MAQVISLTPRHMNIAPIHHRMKLDELARSNSPEPAFGPSSHPPASRSSGSGMTRKRASSSTSRPNSAGHGFFDHMRAESSYIMKPEATRDMICLCTPAPKIPRPRNAFILYRQHHQSQVTADNPKLSNPEISKIIGERWKNEVGEVKETWKKLAEEEKQRHQHQYPNYRYQPRRGAKTQAHWPGSSPSEEQGRCAKCNGRYIATPRTPSTPFATSAAMTMIDVSLHGRPNLPRLNTDTPRRASIDISPPLNALPFRNQPPPFGSPVDNESTSPDPKRLRTDGSGAYQIAKGSQIAYGGGGNVEDAMRNATEARPTRQINRYVTMPLPALETLPRSQSYPMPALTRPTTSWTWSDHDERSARKDEFDETLRLPPLQATIPPSPLRPTLVDDRYLSISVPESGSSSSGESRARGWEGTNLETEIMSIPFRRKLAVLARICRPVPPHGHENPVAGNRGPFIAIEGPIAGMLRDAGNAIEKGLRACREVTLKVWTNEYSYLDMARQRNETTSQSMGTRSAETEGLFSSYLQTVLSWQEKSKQITRHIAGGEGSYATENQSTQEDVIRSRSAETHKPPKDKANSALADSIHVALIREGFSLTLADKFACTTPIADMYGPIDHWQWMASLWRGTVCPDLIVYVKPSEEDEINNFGTVEFSRQMGLIVVRVATNKGLDEATERRMAFEVMEWMREGTFREEVPQNWRLD